jgi:hypothetical protein
VTGTADKTPGHHPQVLGQMPCSLKIVGHQFGDVRDLVLEAFAPVAGSAFKMRNGDSNNPFASFSVHQPVRVSIEKKAARAVKIRRPAGWFLGYQFFCVAERQFEINRGILATLRVPLDGFLRLDNCFRMKFKP